MPTNIPERLALNDNIKRASLARLAWLLVKTRWRRWRLERAITRRRRG